MAEMTEQGYAVPTKGTIEDACRETADWWRHELHWCRTQLWRERDGVYTDAQIEAIVRAIDEATERALREDPSRPFELYCDYEPQGALLDAAHAAGVPVRACCGDARFPGKSGTRSLATGEVTARIGRGGEYLPAKTNRD